MRANKRSSVKIDYNNEQNEQEINEKCIRTRLRKRTRLSLSSSEHCKDNDTSSMAKLSLSDSVRSDTTKKGKVEKSDWKSKKLKSQQMKTKKCKLKCKLRATVKCKSEANSKSFSLLSNVKPSIRSKLLIAVRSLLESYTCNEQTSWNRCKSKLVKIIELIIKSIQSDVNMNQSTCTELIVKRLQSKINCDDWLNDVGDDNGLSRYCLPAIMYRLCKNKVKHEDLKQMINKQSFTVIDVKILQTFSYDCSFLLRQRQQRHLKQVLWQYTDKLARLMAFYAHHIDRVANKTKQRLKPADSVLAQNNDKKMIKKVVLAANKSLQETQWPLGLLKQCSVKDYRQIKQFNGQCRRQFGLESNIDVYLLPSAYDEHLEKDIEFVLKPIKSKCEKYLIGLDRLLCRSEQEIELLVNTLFDYEMICYLLYQNVNGNQFLESKVIRSILMIALEKLYYSINLAQLPIDHLNELTLITTLNNIHLFDKHLFIEKPSIKVAFNHFLVYAADHLQLDYIRIQYLIRTFRYFTYFIDHFKFKHPELLRQQQINECKYQTIDYEKYCKHFAHWYAACLLPTYIDCLKQYKPCDTFGFEFYNDLSPFLFDSFRVAIQNRCSSTIIECEEFIDMFENKFLDQRLPFWSSKYCYNDNNTPLNNLYLSVQQALIETYFVKSDQCDNSTTTDVTPEEFRRLAKLHSKLFKLRPFSCCSNDESKSVNAYECNYCNENEFVFCFIHNGINHKANEMPDEIVVSRHAIPDDWLERILFKLDTNEMVIFLFLTDKFDANRFNLQPDRIDYYYSLQENYKITERFRMVINRPLLCQKRRQLLTYLKEADPLTYFYTVVFKAVGHIAEREFPAFIDRAQMIKRLGHGYGKMSPFRIDFNRIMCTSFMTSIDTNHLNVSLKSLVGRTPYMDGSISVEPEEGTVRFVLLNNLFMRTWEDQYKLWMVDLQNVYCHQLPRMGRSYITRLVFDPRHYTLMLIKNGGKVIGGITFRPFLSQNFSEIVFCAVSSNEQVKGYGTRMMNYLKDYHLCQKIYFLLTYADENAIGYFMKQGFYEEIEMAKEQYYGFIKEYDGATLMECKLNTIISYNAIDYVMRIQARVIDLLVQFNRALNRNVFRYDFGREKRRIIPLQFIERMNKFNIKIDYTNIDFDDHSEQLYQTLNQLLQQLKKHPSAQPFLKWINEKKYPTYYQIIRFPMNLQMMTERLHRKYYCNLHLFHCDITRIFINCRSFFDQDTTEYHCSNLLERFYLNKFKKINFSNHLK